MQHSKTGTRQFPHKSLKRKWSLNRIFWLAKSNYEMSLFKVGFHQQTVGFHEGRMFEVTVDSFEMNIFHRGCLSVGNVRRGYTSRVKDFFSRATG